MKQQRYDRATVLDFADDAAGYLTVTAAITRPGVFPYRRSDGKVRYEAKLPEDIFSDLAVSTARAKPVTDEHPPEPVTSRNWQQYAKGTSHTDSRVEGDMLKISMTVTDPALIQRIRSGDQKEISIGFETDLISEPGEYMGQRYDAKQTNIAINHIAITKQGRAGPTVAIRGDSAYEIDENDKGDETITMAKYTIDGKEFEVPSEVKSRLDAVEAQLESAKTKAATVDTLQGRYDALEATLNTTKQELEDTKKNALTNQLDAAVTARVELIGSAKTFLGDSFNFTGKNDRDVKLAVIQKVKGADFKSDGKTDDYVNAFYDATVERSKADGFSSIGANHMATGGTYSTDSQKKVDENRAARLNMHNKEAK
ncbi:DUF2213 domain-containing protein [Paenibacillus periandrae]|uniref:DUF2213 domain-containing protein n=1 Tax=Paenibacillus periandrae TaxID=1761741 RepID=UPI001F09035F|nr:DUF2213 domain-containing protein [Paenibacillus periandrae]